MGTTGNNGTPAELIAMVKQFPLDGPSWGADYGGFFGDTANTPERDSFISDVCAEIAGQRRKRLALILACIWAKAQVNEEGQTPVVNAAKNALEIMGKERINLDPNALMRVLRNQRESFNFPGLMTMVPVDKYGYARVATQFLAELQG